MKRASQNLRLRIEQQESIKPPMIQITPPSEGTRSYQPSTAGSDANSEIARIQRQLRSFVFDDKGEPSLLRQQLADYKELRKQLKSAVRSADLSKKISEAGATNRVKTRPKATKNKGVKKADEPLLIVNPNHSGMQVEGATNEPQFDRKGAGHERNKNRPETTPTRSDLENATISNRRKDIKDLLALVNFDKEFLDLCSNCSTALDECEQVLQDQTESKDLVNQIELNDQLNYRLEDIYPDIEKSDDLSTGAAAKANSQKGQDAARRLPGLLFDRWETVRVRSATKQNVIEIQMLEDEQYRRMVDGYKSEEVSPKSTISIQTY